MKAPRYNNEIPQVSWWKLQWNFPNITMKIRMKSPNNNENDNEIPQVY